MAMITLAHSTGDALADQTVRKVVSLFEEKFPSRIVGYYVEGSYANQTAVTTSDLDLVIVFRTAFASVTEQEAARQVMMACKEVSVLELDITLTDEQQLQAEADPMFKLGALLLYGEEVRDSVPLIPIVAWARQRMHAAFWLMINVFRRPQPVHAPLLFSQPNDPFYGYAARRMRLADGREIPTTRNLIRVTGWIATARIAHEAGDYVVRKRDCVMRYREMIHDEWTTLLEEIDLRCRMTWHYRIPEAPAEQEELRAILERTLAFENDFLSRYERFLVSELLSVDPVAPRMALDALGRTFYAAPPVVDAVKHLRMADDPEMRAAADKLVL